MQNERLENLRDRLIEKAKSETDQLQKQFYTNVAQVIEEMRIDIAKDFGVDQSHMEKVIREFENLL